MKASTPFQKQRRRRAGRAGDFIRATGKKKYQVESHSLIICNPSKRGCLSPSCSDILFKTLGPVLPTDGMWLYKIYWGHFLWVDLNRLSVRWRTLVSGIYFRYVMWCVFNNIFRINLLKYFGQFKSRKIHIWQNQFLPLGISHWVFWIKREVVTLLNSSALGPVFARSMWKWSVNCAGALLAWQHLSVWKKCLLLQWLIIVQGTREEAGVSDPVHMTKARSRSALLQSCFMDIVSKCFWLRWGEIIWNIWFLWACSFPNWKPCHGIGSGKRDNYSGQIQSEGRLLLLVRLCHFSEKVHVFFFLCLMFREH